MGKKFIPCGYLTVPVHELEVGDRVKIYGEVLYISEVMDDEPFVDDLSGEQYISSGVVIQFPSQVPGETFERLYELYAVVPVLHYKKVSTGTTAEKSNIVPILSSN